MCKPGCKCLVARVKWYETKGREGKESELHRLVSTAAAGLREAQEEAYWMDASMTGVHLRLAKVRGMLIRAVAYIEEMEKEG